ncbi:tetratricopeptide repeat protein [Ornithinibacillus halophilus]|uniref:Tetratricopeptide repeat-containing protein n=1 Tax=Ornithinibacillus halophilus TaxID=930117 RepID=A0A1M5KVQ3_9BACI|nr:tetratricopeptide repeat protein [Ornithinibacillus halophilus]SHG56233.1 Tetratricopeptide repeat-containing protein [Ornithinibacillus halophilus]
MRENTINKLQKAYDFFNQGLYKQAEILYLGVLDKLDKEDLELYKQALHGLGYVKIELDQYQEATEMFLQLLSLAEQEGNNEEKAIAYHQLGMAERKARNYERAMTYFDEEIAIYDTSSPDFHLGYAAAYYEYGTVFMLQDDLETAKEYLEKSVSHAERTDDLVLLGYAYRNLGDVYQAMDEGQKALVFYQSALESLHRGDSPQAAEDVKSRMVGVLQDLENGKSTLN